MNRVEKFRTARLTRFKYIFSFLLFFTLLVSGICVTDYSVNSITRNVKGIGIFSLKSVSESYYEISFANEKVYLDTKYLKRDLERLKSYVYSITGKR